jgi:hypothetical protein
MVMKDAGCRMQDAGCRMQGPVSRDVRMFVMKEEH